MGMGENEMEKETKESRSRNKTKEIVQKPYSLRRKKTGIANVAKSQVVHPTSTSKGEHVDIVIDNIEIEDRENLEEEIFGISNTLKRTRESTSTSRCEEMEIVVDTHAEINEKDNLEDEICGISHKKKRIRRKPRRYIDSDDIVNASTLESISTNRGEEVDIVADIADGEVLGQATIEEAVVEEADQGETVVGETVAEEDLDDREQIYKKLKDNMDWTIIEQNKESVKLIPDWTGSNPVIVRPCEFEPIHYFRLFFDKELLRMICNESNRYALQLDITHLLCLDIKELETFIGTCMYMSLVKLHRSRYYWKQETEQSAISESMTRKRWEEIKSNLHFSDNEKAPKKGTAGYDKVYKIRPYLDYLNDKFNKIPMGENLCVDEMMIPYTGKRGPRYYIKGKPNPWGFKVWGLADSFGIVHNFDMCVGSTPRVEDFPDLKSSANVVAKLASIVPKQVNHKIYMDNLFSTVPLYLEFLKRGIFCTGTVRLNRCSGLKDQCLVPDADIKAKGKSSFIEYEGKIKDTTDDIRVIRWYDNNFCSIMSTMGSAQPISTVQRWDKTLNNFEKTSVPCPGIVKYYNAHMGGIDKMDALVAFYRIFLRSRKWYHRIFFHFLDVCVCQAWLIYRREYDAYGGKPGKHMSLYDFKFAISFSLRKQSQPLTRAGRPSADTVNVTPSTSKKYRSYKKKLPPKSVIEDQIGHFAIALPKRGMCRKPQCKASPVTYCLKCEVYLCMSKGRQCFLDFHNIKYDYATLPK